MGHRRLDPASASPRAASSEPAGADTFDFNGGETGVGPGNRDTVDDFARGSDKLDLAGIDARLDQGGDQKFTLIGGRGFGGVDGQLRTITVGTDTVV